MGKKRGRRKRESEDTQKENKKTIEVTKVPKKYQTEHTMQIILFTVCGKLVSYNLTN